jgi:Malectin domain
VFSKEVQRIASCPTLTFPSNRFTGDQDNQTPGPRTWIADTYFTGGSKYVSPDPNVDFDGTVDDVIYLTMREGVFSYDIAVPPGTYDVILHFVDLYV